MAKVDRASVRAKFNGRCAYCGCELGERWHADHVEPVRREMRVVPGKGLVSTNIMERPENDRADNLFPACPPCNIDKHSLSLESWRQKLQRTCEVLARNNPTYRHGVRFGLIEQPAKPVVFYFEQVQP